MAIEIPSDLGKISDEELIALDESILGLLLQGQLDEESFKNLQAAIAEEMKQRGIKPEVKTEPTQFAQRKMREIGNRLRNSILTLKGGVAKVRSDVAGERCTFFFDEEGVTDAFKGCALKINEILPDKSEHLQFSTKPACSFDMPIYDLCLVPHGREVDFKLEYVTGRAEDVAYFHQLRQSSQQLCGAARSSTKRDEVAAGRFFRCLPFTRCVQTEAHQSVEDVSRSFDSQTEAVTAVARCSDVDVQIHKKGDKIKVWTNEGVECSLAFKEAIEALKEHGPAEDYVLLANVKVMPDGSATPMPSSFIRRFLKNPRPHKVCHELRVFDCLFFKHDLHNLHWKGRIKYFNDENWPALIFSSAMSSESKPGHVTSSIRHYRKHPDVAEVMVYSNDPYNLSPAIGDAIPLYEKTVKFNGIVLDCKKTMIPGVSNLTIGIDPGSLAFSAATIVKQDGKKYAVLGDTISTSRWAYPGEIMEISAREVMHEFDVLRNRNEIHATGMRVVNKVNDVGFPNLAKHLIEEAVDNGVYFSYIVVPGSGIQYNKDRVSEMSALKIFKWEQTENEVRYRVRPPGIFEKDSFRTITLKKSKPTVRAIIARPKGKTGTKVQALRFPKSEGWTLAKAQEWAKSRDFQIHPSREDVENPDGSKENNA